MTPTHGRAPIGERVVGMVPRNRGTVTTMLGALSLTGLNAVMTIEGAMTGPVFCTFVEKVLVPKLKAGDIVVLDNAAAHKVTRAKELVEAVGARLLFLPPYHPDLNPIEEAWSKIKQALRRAEARTLEALDTAIAAAVSAVTPRDAIGWFKHAGYQVT